MSLLKVYYFLILNQEVNVVSMLPISITPNTVWNRKYLPNMFSIIMAYILVKINMNEIRQLPFSHIFVAYLTGLSLESEKYRQRLTMTLN